METSIKEGKLTIVIDTNKKPVASKSGKSLLVASTHGNQATAVVVDGKPLIVAVNAYVKA